MSNLLIIVERSILGELNFKVFAVTIAVYCLLRGNKNVFLWRENKINRNKVRYFWDRIQQEKQKIKSELSYAGSSNRNGNIGEMGTKDNGNKRPAQPSDAGWAGQRKRLAWP